jgi:hypothetical protein
MKEITWFIFTNDSHTNEVISRELPPEDTFDGVKCFDKIKRKLWRCDGQFVTKIKRNEKSKNLHFEIFKREGKYGSIKRADFFGRKKKSGMTVAETLGDLGDGSDQVGP